MMNLEKMKQKKSKNSVKKGLLAATTFLCLTTPLLQTQTAYAAENTTPAITIEKPDGWKQGETTITVTVDASHMPEGFSIAKIEAKAGKDGSWQDITGSGSITITGNQTVYVRVTDGEGKVYEQNRSIKCYDTEKPTLSASLTDGVLTIQGNDTVSGITAVTVNGTTYTDLKDGMLRVQLTQKDFTTKQIEITVTDGAGNTSEKYVLQNPYYEWAKKQAEKQKTSSESNGAMATTTSADATGTEKTTTSPLPQDAQASEPTDAKGTVDDRTVTGIEEQLNKEGETADSVTKTATEGTKEFYTISTKSDKIFYLIIDNSKSQDNVYFLTEVSEKDLMNFTLSDSVTLPEVDTVYAEPEKKAEEEKPETTESTEKDKVEDDIQMPEDKSPFGTYLLIALVAVGAAAGGYCRAAGYQPIAGARGDAAAAKRGAAGAPAQPPCAGGGGDRRASAAELCRAGGYGVRVVRAGRHRPAGKGAARPGVRCGVPFGSRRGAGQSNAVSALFHPAARIVGRRAGAGGG